MHSESKFRLNTWNLDETRNHVERLYGCDQLALVKPCLRSVDDRKTYARIHYEDAARLFVDYRRRKLKGTSFLDLMSDPEEIEWNEFNVLMRRFGAYLTACIQSLHSLPDILSHAVHFSLALNQSIPPLSARKINLSTVVKFLEGEAETEEVRALLVELNKGGEFDHLSALSNSSKHRTIVFPSLREDWTGLEKDKHTMVIAGFKYNDKSYPEVIADEFLAREFKRCSELVIHTGVALNHSLSRRVPLLRI